MRLEPICELRMKYEEGAWLAPFRADERQGYGTGGGLVAGAKLQGTMRWSNHPRRREDGVWCPDLHGRIDTPDGAKVLISVKGYSILEATPTVRRAIVAAVWWQADDDRYQWLNYVLGIGEGEIDEETEEWWLRVYGCLNEVAAGSPSIAGAKLPFP
jgi:hypothetical protein